MKPCPRRSLPSPDPRQDRALAPDAQEPDPAGELLSSRRSRGPDRRLRRPLQPPAIPRGHRQPHPGRRLLRARPDHPAGTRKDQTTDHPEPTLAYTAQGRLTSFNRCARSSLDLTAICLKKSDDGQPGGFLIREPTPAEETGAMTGAIDTDEFGCAITRSEPDEMGVCVFSAAEPASSVRVSRPVVPSNWLPGWRSSAGDRKISLGQELKGRPLLRVGGRTDSPVGAVAPTKGIELSCLTRQASLGGVVPGSRRPTGSTRGHDQNADKPGCQAMPRWRRESGCRRSKRKMPSVWRANASTWLMAHAADRPHQEPLRASRVCGCAKQ